MAREKRPWRLISAWVERRRAARDTNPGVEQLAGEAQRGMHEPDRLLGAVALLLLRHPERWVHRRVETLDIDDPVVIGRRVSVNFTLQRDLVPSWVDGAGDPIHFVPLTMLKKAPLVRFSVRDESGAALPMMTRRRNGVLALSAMVVLAETLASGASGVTGQIPKDLQEDLRTVVQGEPMEHGEIRNHILEPSDAERVSVESTTWRRFLAEDEEFMKALGRLSRNFILAVPLVGAAGVRRVLKFSYEEQGDQPRLAWPKVLRPLIRGLARIAAGPHRKVRTRDWTLALARGMGLKPSAIEIKVPAMSATNSYHLEVAAPNGLQITLGQLRRRDGYVIDECTTSRQRVHLYSTSRRAGKALLALRPRPFAIIRTAWLISLLTFLTVLSTALFTKALVENLSEAASILLLVPAGLAAYVAQTREPVATKEALLGARMLATAIAAWPLAAAALLAIGTKTSTEAPATVLHTLILEKTIEISPYVRPGLACVCVLAAINLLLLSIYLVRVYRPPEQVRVEQALQHAEPTS